MSKTASGDSTNSIQKTCRILSCFSFEHKKLGLIELCDMTGFAKSTIHRICAALMEEGFLIKAADGLGYTLSPKMYELGMAAVHSLDIREIALESMTEMADRLGESTALYVEQNMERLCIAMVESPEEVRIVVPLGRSLPIYLGASGRVLLAYMDEQVRNDFFRKLRKNKPADLLKTVDQLEADINEVHEQGYALTFGERVDGTVSVAVPVFYGAGQMAAIAVHGPTYRMNQSKLQEAIAAALNAAETINRRQR